MDVLSSLLSQVNVGYSPSMKTISDFTNIEEHVLEHLKKVYLTLTAFIGLSAVGAYFQIITGFSSTLASVLTFFLLIGLTVATVTQTSMTNRLIIGGSFAFFEGASLGNLIQYAINVDPNLILIALSCTTLVFASFTGIAMLSPRRSYLYLGSYLSFSIFFMLFAGIFNIFLKSSGINWLLLYGGLVMFMTYVIYDTQIIIEKAHNGANDYVNHAMELFIDFIAIFIRILIILTDKKKKKSEEK